MNSPFKEIDPQPMTDALGNDVLQNMLVAGDLLLRSVEIEKGAFEGRYDLTPQIHGPLTKLYELRQQANAEEWPVASEPIVDEVSR